MFFNVVSESFVSATGKKETILGPTLLEIAYHPRKNLHHSDEEINDEIVIEVEQSSTNVIRQRHTVGIQ